jgi:hypothetical protein
MVVLIGIAGLGVDMGVLRYEKRIQQTAADAAAIAGANNLGLGGVTVGAQNASATNSFTDSGSGQVSDCGSSAAVGTICVQVNNPPQSGPHSANASYVEVLVAKVQPTYFMKVFGVTRETVTARAVATNVRGGGPTSGNGCVYTLGAPTKKLSGVSASGSVDLNAPTCGIIDDGNLDASGGAQLSIIAGSIGVSGDYNPPGSPNATVSPTPVSGVAATGNPVSTSPPCSGSSCVGQNIKITAGSCSGAGCTGVSCSGGTCTISAGTYGSVSIDNNQAVNFSPGTFVVDGSFTVNAGSVLCNSVNSNCGGMPGSANAGVTFYITGNGAVSINGNATIQLTAPNSGTYEGILFYQDPNDTNAASLSGNNTTFYQGALYFPSANLIFGGNNSTTGVFNGGAAYTLIVSDWLTLSGNPTIDLSSDYSGLSGNGGPLAGAISSARLVE